MIEILLIILLSIALYLPTLNYKIIVDDIRQLDNVVKGFLNYPTNIMSWSNLIKRRLYGAGTFLTQFSPEYVNKYLNNQNSFFQNIYFDRLFSVAIHTLNSILIYKVFSSTTISLFAALLYLVNPVTSQLSMWLNGRRYSLVVTLMLTMLLFQPYLLILYPIMFLFHYTAILFPIVMGYEYILIIFLILFMLRKQIKQKVKERMEKIYNKDIQKINFCSIMATLKSYGFYFFRIIFPYKTSMVYSSLYWYGTTEEGNKDAKKFNFMFYKGIAAIVLSITGCFVFTKFNLNIWIFCCLTILQWSITGFSVVQGQADRYISATVPFMMYFVSLLLTAFVPQYTTTILTALLIFYISQLDYVKPMYKNIESFFNYHIFNDREQAYAHSWKANMLISRKDIIAATGVITEGLTYMPNDFRLNCQASEVFFLIKAYPEAKAALKKAEKNIYIGQYESRKKEIDKLKNMLGVTALETEAEKIKNKTSNLSKKQREQVLKHNEDLINV